MSVWSYSNFGEYRAAAGPVCWQTGHSISDSFPSNAGVSYSPDRDLKQCLVTAEVPCPNALGFYEVQSNVLTNLAAMSIPRGIKPTK